MDGEVGRLRTVPCRPDYPLSLHFNYLHSLAINQIDVSPDGRHVVFQSQQVLQENIGMIENLN